MKDHPITNLFILAGLILGGVAQPGAFAQGTAFTYQGQLQSNSYPANGNYDFSFALINSGTGGLLIAGPITNSAVSVSNGLFTTMVDFGSVFTGASIWLQINVSAHGANDFTALLPRQQLTAAPYSITAAHVTGAVNTSQLSGSIATTNLSGQLSTAQLPPVVVTNGASGVNLSGIFSGNGSQLTSLEATNVLGTFSEVFTVGAAGIGTTSPQNLLSVAGGADFSGSIGIGTTSPGAKLDIWGGNANTQGIRLHNTNVSGSHFWNISIDANGDALVFSLDNNWPGVMYSYLSPTSAGLITTSDSRVKKDIEPMPWCLDRLLALTPSTFRYQQAGEDTPLNYGFTAQDVERQFPDLVLERRGLKTLVSAGLTAINTKAIQDLSQQTDQKIQKLETENAQLKQELSELRAIVNRLAQAPK